MLAILTLLSLGAVGGWLVQQRRRRRAVAIIRRAMDAGDYATLERIYRSALLRRDLAGEQRALLELAVAAFLAAQEKHADSIAQLDQIDVRTLRPAGVATWLNNRAYGLALLGHADEALPLLDDADDLVEHDEALPSRQLLGCIAGTRGIALHLSSRHDEAESALHGALETGKSVVDSECDPQGPLTRGERLLAAERWWWLAESAHARGDENERRLRLERSAAVDNGGRFGDRARSVLAGNADCNDRA